METQKRYTNNQLIGAVKSRDEGKIRDLLEKGADINATDEDGWTVLIYASNNGHLEIVRLLLEKGANINVTNQYGYTSLMRASKNGYLETVKLLLKNGAYIGCTI